MTILPKYCWMYLQCWVLCHWYYFLSGLLRLPIADHRLGLLPAINDILRYELYRGPRNLYSSMSVNSELTRLTYPFLIIVVLFIHFWWDKCSSSSQLRCVWARQLVSVIVLHHLWVIGLRRWLSRLNVWGRKADIWLTRRAEICTISTSY